MGVMSSPGQVVWALSGARVRDCVQQLIGGLLALSDASNGLFIVVAVLWKMGC